jgi:hypothetical protein
MNLLCKLGYHKWASWYGKREPSGGGSVYWHIHRRCIRNKGNKYCNKIQVGIIKDLIDLTKK